MATRRSFLKGAVAVATLGLGDREIKAEALPPKRKPNATMGVCRSGRRITDAEIHRLASNLAATLKKKFGDVVVYPGDTLNITWSISVQAG
jgi:hypothetical protein